MFEPLPLIPLCHSQETKEKQGKLTFYWLGCVWDIESSLFSFPSRLTAMKQRDSNNGVGPKEMG